MAFNTNIGREQFTATSGQTEFNFNFAIFVDTDIKVYKTASGSVPDDTADILTLSTDYTVAIDGVLGGTVTLASGATLNDTITVVRELPITRTTDYQDNGDLFAQTIDNDQDYQTYLVQDTAEQLTRTVKLPDTIPSGVTVQIPNPVADAYFKWNSTADAIENDITIPQSVVDSAASAAAAALSESNAAASAVSAAASYDSFDDRYLGAKSSDPTLDNDGNALLTGAIYFNTSLNEWRAYNGSNWLNPLATNAINIINTPSGNISATDIQNAINELDAGKQALAPNYTGIMATIASAATTNIGAAPADYLNVTGTTTITAFDTVAAGVERTLKFVGALTLTHNATSLILPTGTNITTVAGDTAIFRSEGSGNWRLVGGTIYTRVISASITSAVTGVRQTVQSGSVDSNGFANFISIGTGLSVNISATTTPITIHAAGGKVSNDRLGTISADTTISGLTANATNYLYADIASNGTVTLGATVQAPIYQFGGTPATTDGLTTFNIGQMTGYTGNGTTAPQSWRVFLGEAVTGASAVTSVVNYALNGLYDSGFFLVTTNTIYSKNHNLGVPQFSSIINFQATSSSSPFSAGDIFEAGVNPTNGSATGMWQYPKTYKIFQIRTYASYVYVNGASGGGSYAPTAGNYQFIIKRSW